MQRSQRYFRTQLEFNERNYLADKLSELQFKFNSNESSNSMSVNPVEQLSTAAANFLSY